LKNKENICNKLEISLNLKRYATQPCEKSETVPNGRTASYTKLQHM